MGKIYQKLYFGCKVWQFFEQFDFCAFSFYVLVTI